MELQEKPRDFRGVSVYNKLLGKVRPTDASGVDITEQSKHSLKVSIVQSENIKMILVDSEGNEIETVPITLTEGLPAGDNYIGMVGHNITTIADNRKTVTTAGTAVSLVDGLVSAKYVLLTALSTNTGVIVFGGNTVVAAAATRRGTPLNPGASAGIPVDDLSDVYLDATVSGEGVSYTYFL